MLMNLKFPGFYAGQNEHISIFSSTIRLLPVIPLR
jgi:hypothetical protein